MSKLDDFLNLQWKDIEGLPASELRKVARVGINEANRRLTALEKSEYAHASVEYGIVMKEGKVTGRFEIKDGMSPLRAKSEIMRAQLFLRAQTSTVKGTKEFVESIEKRLETKLTPQQVQRLFKLYDEFKIKSPASTVGVGSVRMQKYFAEQVKKTDEDITIDDILDDAEKHMQEEYEKQELEEYTDIFEQLGL